MDGWDGGTGDAGGCGLVDEDGAWDDLEGEGVALHLDSGGGGEGDGFVEWGGTLLDILFFVR